MKIAKNEGVVVVRRENKGENGSGIEMPIDTFYGTVALLQGMGGYSWLKASLKGTKRLREGENRNEETRQGQERSFRPNVRILSPKSHSFYGSFAFRKYRCIQ